MNENGSQSGLDYDYFVDLPIGAAFNFSRNPESGLLADLGKRGERVYVKRSARTYTDASGNVLRVGSVNVRVWKVTR